MADNFDFKKFLAENKLGAYSKAGKLNEDLGLDPGNKKQDRQDLEKVYADMQKGGEDDAPPDEPENEARIDTTPWGSKIDTKEEAYSDKREWLKALLRMHPFIKNNPNAYMHQNEKGDISVSQGLEHFGSWYNGGGYYKEKYGTVSPSQDMHDKVYPQGSRKD